MRASESEFVTLRGCRMHLRVWGPADAPKMFLVHGWGDTSASYQFVVDALRREWRILALDWRGFGQSQWNQGTYWYPDYFADLDALLDHYSPGEAVRLIGHSMGGTVASIYSGVRAGRVAQFISLEGGGLRRFGSGDAPGRVRKWLDQVRAGPGFRVHQDRTAFARRLMDANSRLTPERAAYLAGQVTVECEGGVRFAIDPAHYWVNPVYYSIDDAMASWRLVTARVLWIAARDSFVMKSFAGREEEYRERLGCFRDLREVVLEDCGHNMHHDQPELVAGLIEGFLE